MKSKNKIKINIKQIHINLPYVSPMYTISDKFTLLFNIPSSLKFNYFFCGTLEI